MCRRKCGRLLNISAADQFVAIFYTCVLSVVAVYVSTYHAPRPSIRRDDHGVRGTGIDTADAAATPKEEAANSRAIHVDSCMVIVAGVAESELAVVVSAKCEIYLRAVLLGRASEFKMYK